MRLGSGIFLGCKQFVDVDIDPLAGYTWGLRLQTHNGDGVPLGLWQDTTFTIPAQNDFDPIGGWTDELSDSGAAVIQSDLNLQPYLLFIDGIPTIQCDGVDDFFQGAVSGLSASQLSVFASAAIESSDGALYDATNASGLTNICSLLFRAAPSLRFRIGDAGGTGSDVGDATVAFSDTGWHVFSGLHTLSERSLYIDGVLQNTNTTDVVATPTPTQLRIGRLFENYFPLGGGLVALLLSPDTLNPTDRGTVETYLATLTP
jgi:hypothetical protein